MLKDIQERVAAAVANRSPLRLRGGGTKDWYGQAPHGEALDLAGYRGIVDYDPAELVVTARCGTTLAELEAELAAKRQMLAFDPPRHGAAATLGGAIASGLSGPRRLPAGSARDFVLGVELIDGSGVPQRFGGRVMKNVAGYDVSRLLTGSLGILGVLTEISVKVLPMPIADATLEFSLPQADAIARLNGWGGKPLPLVASSWLGDATGGVLRIRLSGARAAVDAARRTIGAELGGSEVDPAAAAAWWDAMRDQTADVFAPAVRDGRPLWRLSVPTTAAPLDLDGTQLIEWGGGQRWWIGDRPAAQMRALAGAAGGHATLFRNGDKAAGVFTPLPAALDAIHRRLKQSFDPAGVFNPGRLYPDL